ncbi:hypothetical protein C8R46DRAFT_1201843 [Mycena filopes]|nr:hypothetical protein C8R46DRAFT_1201843 [Mycena filopes]
MDYYQLGGFDASIHLHPMYSLGERVYPTLRRQQHPGDQGGELRLVLGLTATSTGIKTSGTSHVLVTRDERDAIQRESIPFKTAALTAFNHRRFENATERGEAERAMFRTFIQFNEGSVALEDFESLSPIFFRGMGELSAKLAAVTPTKQSTHDNSRANKTYQDVNVAYGIARGQFENSRVVYQVLQNNLSGSTCGLRDTSWRTSLRVFSFCCNVWLKDTRTAYDRRKVPKILDFGWCECDVPKLEPKEGTQRHIVLKDNRQFTNPGKNDPYEYGETELCSAQSASHRIQAVFSKFAQSQPYPSILLVHDVETTIPVLKSLGIDMELWEFDLKALLRPTPMPPPQESDTPRARSASPGPSDRDRPRHNSPPLRRYAPMYVVDVQALFTALLGVQLASKSVPGICKRLSLYQPTGWCAGNECWMMVDVFRSMAAGRAIDEQAGDIPVPPPVPVVRKKKFDGPEIESESEYGDSEDGY